MSIPDSGLSSVDQHGPEPETDRHRPTRVGTEDRPREEAGPQVPEVGDRISATAENAQASGLGTGPQLVGTALGDRDGDGPRRSPGTDGGSGTGDRQGAIDPVAGDGAALLDELRAAIGRYTVLPSEEALTAVTLWVAATHIQPALQHAPRLAVVSATKGSGKSRVLDVLHETVHQPMMTVNTSPAVIFRVIGKNPPTLLVDEADTIFGPKAGEKEDLRGLLNAGHQRNRPAWRISGPEHKPTAFPTFAMAALAGIGDLPDTIMDRAVVIRIQKRKPGERLTPFRSRYAVPELNALRDQLAAWLIPLRDAASCLVPAMPVEDRAADTWEPLVIVAELAGGHWPASARAACLAMTGNEAVQDEERDLKKRLLRDIHRVFERAGSPDVLSTQSLLAALHEDAESPWPEYGTKGLTAYHLSTLLREFGISPANHRFDKGKQAKAYARNRFLDAWERHIPAPAQQPAPLPERPSPASAAQRKPPAPPAGSLPVGQPGGIAGPGRAR
ncbi:DUF3631 domain-containing protein [Streptomyces sp. NPDC050485]|uniref:DUF3631 domain-containing protein n=1 Tax=Streptomyces sp. NPDC050485 TaxID=3365617 RepID=UPI003788142A